MLKEIDMQLLYSNVRALRIMSSMTQAEVAEKIHLHVETYKHIEQGVLKNPPFRVIWNLSILHDVNVVDLYFKSLF